MNRAHLVNLAAVFVSPDLRRAAEHYRDVFGFELVEHYEASEPFAALYRDEVEIVVVEATRGAVESNEARYGAGFDAYIDPATVEEVDLYHAELRERGARILSPPAMTRVRKLRVRRRGHRRSPDRDRADKGQGRLLRERTDRPVEPGSSPRLTPISIVPWKSTHVCAGTVTEAWLSGLKARGRRPRRARPRRSARS